MKPIDIEAINKHAIREAQHRIGIAQKSVAGILDEVCIQNGINAEAVGKMGMSPGQALGKAIFGNNKEILETMTNLIAHSLIIELMSKINEASTNTTLKLKHGKSANRK